VAFDTPTQTNKSSLKSSMDDRGRIVQTSVRNLQFASDAPNTDNIAIARAHLYASGIVEGSVHPEFGPPFYLRDIDVDREGPIMYTAVCTYRTPQLDASNPNEPYPWNLPARVNFFTVKSEEPIDVDIDGNPIVNKAGERVQGLTRKVSDQGIRLAKAFLTYSPSAFYTFIDSVNSDTFLGFPPGVLNVDDIDAQDDKFGTAITFYNVSVTILARKPYNTTNAKAWWKRFINEGFYARPSSGQPPEPAINPITKEPVTTPVLLDTNGVAVADAVPPSYPAANWIEKEVFEQRAFSNMGFF
jgi:hypothetical protein